MDRRIPLVAVALAALLVLAAVWQAVDDDAPEAAALDAVNAAPDGATPGMNETVGQAADSDADADDAGPDDADPADNGQPPAAGTGPANATADGVEPAPQTTIASCAFEHRGARSPGPTVGVHNSGDMCQFRVEGHAWSAVRVTVRAEGVQAQQGLEAVLYGHRGGGMDRLGSAVAEAVPGSDVVAWNVTADPDALGDAYSTFELRIDHDGVGYLEVRVDAVLTF